MKIKNLTSLILVLDILVFTIGMTSVSLASSPTRRVETHLLCQNHVCSPITDLSGEGKIGGIDPSEHLICKEGTNICRTKNNASIKTGAYTVNNGNTNLKKYLNCQNNVCQNTNNPDFITYPRQIDNTADDNTSTNGAKNTKATVRRIVRVNGQNIHCVNNVCTNEKGESVKNPTVNSVPDEMENTEGIGGDDNTASSNANTNTNTNSNTNTINVVDNGAESAVTDNESAENESIQNGKGKGTLPETGANPFVPGLAASLLASTIVWLKTRRIN